MPDSSIMLALCEILGISVNDLLCGEVVTMENYNKELENNLMDAIKQKEEADKRLLALEVYIGITATVILFVLIFVVAFASMVVWLKVALVAFGFALFLAGCFFALRIEQLAGYYVCQECGYRYVPTYMAVNLAPHMGRTRRMKCPKCSKRSWQKKEISKK
jgi:hypothetical protein